MRNHGLVKAFGCGADVTKYRIVKFGSADDTVVQASAATDSLLGVADLIGGKSGGPVDVVMSGAAEVEYGGNVTRGALLTADSTGKAITATTNVRVIGVAMVSGVSGDIGSVLISPSFIPTPGS